MSYNIAKNNIFWLFWGMLMFDFLREDIFESSFVSNFHKWIYSNIHLWVMSHPSITRHWARPSSWQALSHQLKKRGSQDVRGIWKTEKVSYHDFMDDLWCSRDRSWTKDSVSDVFEALSISEPGRDVPQSQHTFQTTDKHVKS